MDAKIKIFSINKHALIPSLVSDSIAVTALQEKEAQIRRWCPALDGGGGYIN